MKPEARQNHEFSLTQSLIQRDPSTITSLAKINFFLLGCASLMSWNAVLTGLDYFASKFVNYNVYFLFSIPLFISQNIVCLLISFSARFLTLRMRIIGGQIVTFGLMVSLPIIAYFVPNDTGFWIDMVIIFILGGSNALLQSSGIAFASTFPFTCVSLFFTGTAVAGLSINLLRVIFLAIFGSGDDGVAYGVVAYFIVAAIFGAATIFVYLCFFKSTYCKIALNEMRRRTEIHCEDLVENIVISPMIRQDELEVLEQTDAERFAINKNAKDNDTKNETKGSVLMNRNSIAFVWRVFVKIQPFPVLCWLIYVQTFMMFPGVALKKNVENLSGAWCSTLLVLVFNFFDTVGKYLSEIQKLYNGPSTTILVLSRFIFFITFLKMVQEPGLVVIGADWFAFVNMAVFAFTNGFCTSCVMILAPQKANDEEKETAGFLMSFPLVFGITCGTLLALVFATFPN